MNSKAEQERNARVLEEMQQSPDNVLVVAVRKILEVPPGFTPIAAVPGTAAHEYIVDVGKLETMYADPRYIGSFIEPDGYTSIFTDGSTLKTEISSPFLRASSVRPTMSSTEICQHGQVITPPREKKS